MINERKLVQRLLAIILTSSLILISPGYEAYAAMGKIAPIQVQTPVGNNAVGAAFQFRRPTLFGPQRTTFQGGRSLKDTAAAPTVTLTPSVIATQKTSVSVEPSFGNPGTIANILSGVKTGPLAVAAPAKTSDKIASTGVSQKPENLLPVSIDSVKTESSFGALGKTISSRFAALRKVFSTRGAKTDLAPAHRISGSLQTAGLGTTPKASLTRSAKTSLNATLGKSLPVAASPSKDAAESTPAAASKAKKGKWYSGFMSMGKAAVFFLLALVIGQIGIESLGAAMPSLLQKSFGDDAPEFLPVIIDRARMITDAGDWRRAYKTLEKALRRRPRGAVLDAIESTVPPEEAVRVTRLYSKLVASHAESAVLRLRAARYLIEHGRVEEAADVLNAMSENGDGPKAQALWGEIHNSRDDTALAHASYQQALAADQHWAPPYVCEVCATTADAWQARCHACGAWGMLESL